VLELVVSGYTLAYAMLLIHRVVARLRPRWKRDDAGLRAHRAGCGRRADGGAVLIGIRLDIDEAHRGRALGLYSVVLSGSAVIGQALGGVLVSSDLFGAGWRPIFLINIPIGLALALLARRARSTERTAGRQRLDLVGVATLSVALLLLVLPLVLGRDEGWSARTYVCVAASLPAFALFVLAERRLARRAGHPLIALELLRRKPVVSPSPRRPRTGRPTSGSCSCSCSTCSTASARARCTRGWPSCRGWRRSGCRAGARPGRPAGPTGGGTDRVARPRRGPPGDRDGRE
jgi:MFS family permease